MIIKFNFDNPKTSRWKLLMQALGIMLFMSCCDHKPTGSSISNLEGTWQLISGTIIEKGDTVLTDYTKARRMIKVINKTHFSFLTHDLAKGKDSTALFSAGGGRYDLVGNQYTEHLEYCSDRAWEENDFQFTIDIQNDTLTQRGIEKIDGTALNRMNIEKYVRLKN